MKGNIFLKLKQTKKNLIENLKVLNQNLIKKINKKEKNCIQIEHNNQILIKKGSLNLEMLKFIEITIKKNTNLNYYLNLKNKKVKILMINNILV